MGKSLHIKTLATAIGIALAGAVLPMQTVAAATPAEKVASSQQVSVRHIYIVRFVESGLLHYAGNVNGIAATAPAASSRKLDVRSSAAVAYKDYLAAQRDTHLAAIDSALGRNLAPSHSYAITMNGVAVELTAAEARTVAGLSGVRDVRQARDEQLHTFRGPEFIGADTIWDGSNVPGNVATRGQGVVVGVIDSGANTGHPSFADDAACGFDASNHKQLSAVDCGTSAGGVCTGPNPEANDGNGHGVHTASTAAGNTLTAAAVPPPTLPPGETFMSGVAPCASLRTYKVCETNTCSGAAIVAAIENAIADGVDVINYSISGGNDPWNDGDRMFLDAVGADIFVAASAGNTRAETPDPVGAVNHLGPWVTTVAASTHDGNVASDGSLSVTGPGAPGPALQNIPLNPGSGPNPGTAATGTEIRHYVTNPTACTATGGVPAGTFTGAVALIPRGGCSFEEKANNAQVGGATVAVIYNNAAGVINMNTGAATLPAYSILQTEGQAIDAFITASAPTATTGNFAPAVIQGDILAGFSLRGPSALTSVTKPDITGPGVNIYAAVDDATTGGYGFNSGTSMSSPHLAGAGALLRAVHPDWTPAEVKSALMLTAFTDGHKENLTTSWDPDDVGGGRVDLTMAAKSGLVMNETFANFLAANPATSGDPMTLNIPSMRNLNCVDSCEWTRTVRNAFVPAEPADRVFADGFDGAAPVTAMSWTATAVVPSGLNVTVSPTSFVFDSNTPQSQELTITATPTAALTEITFAEVVLHEANGLAPDAHMYVAVQGSGSGGGDIVDSGVINLDIPETLDGIYVNWLTGDSCGSAAACDATFNAYSTGGLIHFFWPNAGGGNEAGVGSAATSQYSILASGASIGPASEFITLAGDPPADMSNWAAGVSGNLGFKFDCAAPTGVCFGYANIVTTAGSGFPATIARYWYNSAGDAITIP